MSTINDVRARMSALMLNEDFQSALNRITKKSDEVKAMDPAQRDIITNKLLDTADYIDNFGPITTIKKYFVEAKGFSEGDWSDIEKLIQSLDAKSMEYFTEYIKNPAKIDYFTAIESPTNITDKLAKDFGLNKKVTSLLFNTSGRMKSGKGVGKGELFLGLMIDGATNASKGDVNVNGSPFEVKGLDARLNTQNGFGLGSAAMINFFDEFERDDEFNQYATEFGSKSKDNIRSYNFYKGTNDVTKGKGSRFYELFDTVPKYLHNKLIKLIASTLFCGPSGIWGNGAQFTGEVEKAIETFTKKYNKKDDTMMNYKLMWINIKYYQSQEFFNGIFFVNPSKGNLAYLPISNEDMSDWLSKNVSYKSPSWQDNPTSNSWKVTLR